MQPRTLDIQASLTNYNLNTKTKTSQPGTDKPNAKGEEKGRLRPVFSLAVAFPNHG